MRSHRTKLIDTIENSVAVFCRWNVRWFALALLTQDWLDCVTYFDHSQQWVKEGHQLLQLSVVQDFDRNDEPIESGFTVWIVESSEDSRIVTGIARESLVAFVGELISADPQCKVRNE